MVDTKYTSIDEVIESVPRSHWNDYYEDMLPVVMAFAGTHHPVYDKQELSRLRQIYNDTMADMLPKIIPNEKENQFYRLQVLSNRTNHTHVHILCVQHACVKIGGDSATPLFQALMGKAIEDTPLHQVTDRR